MINLLSPVKELMSNNLITVNEETPIAEIDSIFKENRIHHIPVVKFDKLVGIISSVDFLNFKGAADRVESKYEDYRFRKHSASDIMTTGIAKLESTDRIGVAVKIFEENLFHAIPIEENGKLIGILTTYDLINGLSNALEALSS